VGLGVGWGGEEEVGGSCTYRKVNFWNKLTNIKEKKIRRLFFSLLFLFIQKNLSNCFVVAAVAAVVAA